MNRPAKTIGSAGRESVCAIDLGSKNFKLVHGWREDGRVVARTVCKVEVGLGRELGDHGGVIGAEKLAQVIRVLAEFADRCQELGASKLLAIGTSAVKSAVNHDALLVLARARGITIEIADGRREGEVGYLAATRGLAGYLVTELGSNSSQIAWRIDGSGIQAQRVNSGYVLAYERFFGNGAGFSQASGAYREHLEASVPEPPAATREYTALAASTLGSFVTGVAKQELEGEVLRRDAVSAKLAELSALPLAEYQAVRASMARAEKILPGLVFVDYMMGRTGHRAVRIARAELPVGLIVEYLGDSSD